MTMAAILDTKTQTFQHISYPCCTDASYNVTAGDQQNIEIQNMKRQNIENNGNDKTSYNKTLERENIEGQNISIFTTEQLNFYDRILKLLRQKIKFIISMFLPF